MLRHGSRGILGLVTTALTAMLLLGLAAQASAADQTYVPAGIFSEEGVDPGQLDAPRRSAVELSTGNLFVADSDNSRISIFAPEASGGSFLTSFGAAALARPFGVAIDQSTGDVYVSDGTKHEIHRFTSDGEPTPTYTLDNTFVGPATGGEPGQIGNHDVDIAVDPTSGDLLVLDAANDRINRYDGDGTFLSSFDGADSPDGAFTGLLDLDVAPNGDIYVVDSTGPVFEEGENPGEGGPGTCVQSNYCDDEPSRVLVFNPDGTYKDTVQALESTSAGLVAVDPDTSQVTVLQVNPQTLFKMYVYAPGGSRLIDDRTIMEGTWFTWVRSLAIGAGGRLYVVADKEWHNRFEYFVGAVALHAFDAVDLPAPTIAPVSGVTAETADLSGNVNPNGTATSWRFQYRPVGGESWQSGPGGDAGSGTSPVAVSGSIEGLQPSTEYELRLLAKSAGEREVFSSTVTFTTAGAAPLVHTRFAAPRTDTTARLNGYVNARNTATTYHFEWGESDEYGNATPALSAGSGGDQLLASTELSGLEPSTTYHYRLVATNPTGTSNGEDRTFTTRTAVEMVPPVRGIELVNPPDKGNQNPYGYLTPNGESVLWVTYTGGPGSPIGMSAFSLAKRTPTGWQSKTILPPARQMVGEGSRAYNLAGATADYSEKVFEVGLSPNDEGSDPPMTLVRVASDFSQTILHDFDEARQGVFYSTKVSADLNHIYMLSTAQIDPEHPAESKQLYDFGTEPPTLVSREPGGAVFSCGLYADLYRQDFGDNTRWSSEDGSRAFFEASDATGMWSPCESSNHIYLHDNGGNLDPADDTVIRIDPPASTNNGSTLLRAARDGKSMVFGTEDALTDDDENTGADIYRWSEADGVECLTCVVANAEVFYSVAKDRQLFVSDDLSHIYFTSPRRLLPGLGNAAGPNLYVWNDGEIRYVAPQPEIGSGNTRVVTEASPDGSVLIFRSESPGLTSEETGGHLQYYRYDDRDWSLECLSCAPSGYQQAEADPDGHAVPGGGFSKAPSDAGAPQLTDDGSTFVFLTAARLVYRDVNGDLDAYQWRNGRVSLITDGVTDFGGASTGRLGVNGISGDGVNVLLRTGKPLTGYERDNVAQLYMARIGGGFGRPPAERQPCVEDACQGPLSAPPPLLVPGSAAVNGPGNAVTSKPAKKCKPAQKGKKGKKAKKRCQAKRKHRGKRGKHAKKRAAGAKRAPSRVRG